METLPPNPFKGLRPYKQEDQEKLFGRERDLILMKDRIFSARTTLLFAASGVGKTSFLNAKVIPELKKQCAVVWHNRWTGADELAHTDDEFDDDRGIRFWPPRALFQDVIRALRGKRDDEAPNLTPPRVGSEQNEERLTSEINKVIARSLRSSAENTEHRLSQVLAGFRKSSASLKDLDSAPDKLQSDRCVLILDQFEEVFQYHAYEDYFGRFVKDLCEIINNEDYQVRVVFSMREEFLGELSIFDNKIPDLFNNYYRLRYPDKDETQDIIRRTCQLSGVDPDEENLRSLVEDLSKIEKGGGSLAERSTGQNKTRAQVVKRNFVAPPYLQIACERLWNKQYALTAEKQAGSLLTKPIVISDEGTSYTRFLTDYRAGNGDSTDQEPGGDAQKALRSFCEEKLSSPFLSRNEQNIVARAFGFLVTKQGAKMAYELRSLAEHMDERVWPLKTALEKLSQDDAKILRESRGPDRSYWFELYHDMYASIVDEWKIRHIKLWKRRTLIKWITSVVAVAGVTAGSLILLFAIATWVIYPSAYKNELMLFKQQLNTSNIERQLRYMNARDAYLDLRGTPGYSRTANSLWADILERRAQWFESENDPSSALLCLLKAAAIESDPQKRNQHLEDAETLLGTTNGSLLATYCDDCASANISPDGQKVLTRSLGGQVELWDAESGALPFPICDNCTLAIFNADGTAVLTGAIVPSTEARALVSGGSRNGPSGDQAGTPTALIVRVWDAKTQAELTKPIDFLNDKKVTGKGSNSPPVDVGSDTPAADPPDFQIRAFTRIGRTFWLLGVKAKQLFIWGTQGTSRPLVAMTTPSVSLTFSNDGRYLFASFPNQPDMIWKLTESDVVKYPLSQLNDNTAVSLSPNGRSLLTAGRDKIVRMIDLESRNTLFSLPQFIGVVRSMGFSPSGEQFFTRMANHASEDIQVWKTDSGGPLLPALKVHSGAIRTALGPEGKTFLRVGNYRPNVIEKWDTQTGSLLGVIKREFGFQTPPTVSPDGNSVFISGKMARLWRFDSNMEGSRFIRGDIEPADLSLDGRVLLTLSSSSTLQFWETENGTTLGDPILPNAVLTLASVSGNGKYAAAADEQAIRVWQVGRNEPIATLPYAGTPSSIAFSADNKMLAAVNDSGISLWNLVNGKEITVSEQHTNAVIDIALAGDRMISGSDDKTARIWDLHTGQKMHLLQHNAPVTAVALTLDGKLALTGCDDGTLRLWNVESGTQVGGELKYEGAINNLAFSGDGGFASAITPSWMYLCSVQQDRLDYLKGALIADPWEPLLGILDNGRRFRFVYQLGRDGLQLQDLRLDRTEGLSVFKGDPKKLLEDWQRKLGLSIRELGQIEKPRPDVIEIKEPTSKQLKSRPL